MSSIYLWIRYKKGKWIEVIQNRYPKINLNSKAACVRGIRIWATLRPYQLSRSPNWRAETAARKYQTSPWPKTSRSTTLTKRVQVEAVVQAQNSRTRTLSRPEVVSNITLSLTPSNQTWSRFAWGKHLSINSLYSSMSATWLRLSIWTTNLAPWKKKNYLSWFVRRRQSITRGLIKDLTRTKIGLSWSIKTVMMSEMRSCASSNTSKWRSINWMNFPENKENE